jgi:predicted DNA-binding ribbon-helix-helix protein
MIAISSVFQSAWDQLPVLLEGIPRPLRADERTCGKPTVIRLASQPTYHRVGKTREQSYAPVAKRSVVIGGHKTSVSLEEAFWSSMKEIAGARHITLSDLVSEIDRNRDQGNLSSAIRLQVLAHYRNQMMPSDLPSSLPRTYSGSSPQPTSSS